MTAPISDRQTAPAGIAVPATVNVLGIRVAALTLRGAAERILGQVAAGRKGYVCVTGVHGLIESRAAPELQRIHNRAALVVPDGMPLVWALRHGGFPAAERVYGPDLMLEVLDRGRAGKVGHFLYGTTPAVLERLEARLTQRFPGLHIAGRYAPPFRPLTAAEEAEVIRDIDRSGAGIVWVGLSTPKQERWMAAMRDRLQVPMLIGVGAAFDFHAGLKPQAPPALQRRGLEWAYRLATEPRRLWRRYARIVPAYLALRALQRTGLRRFPVDGAPDPGAALAPAPDAAPSLRETTP